MKTARSRSSLDPLTPPELHPNPLQLLSHVAPSLAGCFAARQPYPRKAMDKLISINQTLGKVVFELGFCLEEEERGRYYCLAW